MLTVSHIELNGEEISFPKVLVDLQEVDVYIGAALLGSTHGLLVVGQVVDTFAWTKALDSYGQEVGTFDSHVIVFASLRRGEEPFWTCLPSDWHEAVEKEEAEYLRGQKLLEEAEERRVKERKEEEERKAIRRAAEAVERERYYAVKNETLAILQQLSDDGVPGLFESVVGGHTPGITRTSDADGNIITVDQGYAGRATFSMQPVKRWRSLTVEGQEACLEELRAEESAIRDRYSQQIADRRAWQAKVEATKAKAEADRLEQQAVMDQILGKTVKDSESEEAVEEPKTEELVEEAVKEVVEEAVKDPVEVEEEEAVNGLGDAFAELGL